MDWASVEVLALANSALCFLLTVVVALAMRGVRLKRQLTALRFLTSYVTFTLLLNLYLLGVHRSGTSEISFALSAATVVVLWLVVYTLWAKGE